MIIFDLFEDNNKKPLAEFAPSDSSNSNDGFSEETLKQLAAQWYNGDEDPEVERTLMVAGWEIGQDEGYDDEPGVFVVQAGDVNGNSYISWPADELRQGISEGEFTISDDPAAHIKLLFLKTINGNEYRLVKQGDVYNIYINRSRKSKQEFPSFDLAKRALQQLLLNAVHSDQQGVTEGQYEIHHLDPKGRRKAIYHHGRGYTDDVVRKDTQYHQKQNPRDTFRVFKDKQPFDWQGVEEGKKRKKKKASKSLGRYFFPGYGYYGSGESSEGGGDGGGGESVNRNVAEAIREKGALKAAQAAAKFIVRNLDDRNALRNYSAHFWSPEKFYQGATMAMRPGISVDDIVKAIKQDRPAQFEGVAESLEDHERYQYIVTLKSGKRIRFLCGADCDVKTYIERKYNEPVVDIKDQGIVGEPPVELLPGEMKESVTYKGLNESMLLEDPIYRKFNRIGRYIAERRMSEKEILDIFAQAETSMTNKDTGANRTMVGKGKDTATKFAGDVKQSINSILKSVQDSVPAQAVDVAYMQATEALGKLAGGDKGKVMKAIKTYRNLAKEYPKTAGFAKAALVGITGMITGGAGLPAAAGLVYGLDSAIKGDKLSAVLGKGVGATALAAAGQAVYGAFNQVDPAIDGSQYSGLDAETMAKNAANAKAYGIDGADTIADMNKAIMRTAEPGTTPADYSQLGAAGNGTEYTVVKGDTLSDLAKANNVSVDDMMNANPDLTNPDVLKAGQKITIPAETGNSVYDQGVGTGSDTATKIASGRYAPNPSFPKESIDYRAIILPATQLIDQKMTAFNRSLNEGIGRSNNSINFTILGTYTVFENIDRYRVAIMEKAGVAGSTRPEYYAPDMPGGPGKKSKPGMIGRGLNWLDKTTGRVGSAVGSALGNFGHQFTTGVTKEKLKLNWDQAGRPSDSDELASWLVTQKVPQEVVSSVYKKMGIPYTTPDAVPDNSPMGNMASQLMKAGGSGPSSTGGATQTTATGMKHTANPNNPNATRVAPAQTPAARPATTAPTSGFNYDSVMKQPGMQAYAKPAPAKPVANYGGGQAGYGQVASTFGGYNQPKASAVKSTTATPIATPTNKISAPPPKGAPTPAEKAQLDKKIQQAMQAQPVTEVSPEYIERYKKEHGRRATAADQAGDYAKGHEHFKKINKLTKQQFQRGTKPEKVDEISNFMTEPTKPVSPEEQWKRQIRLLAKQYQANAGSLAALGRENGPDSAEAVAYEYLRDPSKIRVPGMAAPASAVNWDEVIRRLPMGLSGMALLQAAEEHLINNRGMLRSTVRSLLNNDENQRSLSAAYAKKKTPAESVIEESDNEAVEQAIIRRIMVGRTDLLLKYGPKKVMQAVEDVADYVGAVDEIGSSDVSGWVGQVERELGGMAEAANPAQQAAIAINMKRHHTKPKKK